MTSSPRIELTGADMACRASAQAYKRAGVTPNDIQVIELHDCFAPNELLTTYEAIGLAPEGQAHHTSTGRQHLWRQVVVNPLAVSESKGHVSSVWCISVY